MSLIPEFGHDSTELTISGAKQLQFSCYQSFHGPSLLSACLGVCFCVFWFSSVLVFFRGLRKRGCSLHRMHFCTWLRIGIPGVLSNFSLPCPLSWDPKGKGDHSKNGPVFHLKQRSLGCPQAKLVSHLLKRICFCFVSSPVGFKGNLSLLEACFFSGV